MAANPARLLQHLRGLASPSAHTVSDAVLLERFCARRDEESFAALVARHGPMVRKLCGRILVNTEDAEDAFQATFLVLARKAAAVRPQTLASWLYGVAYRVACKARGAAARRKLHPLPLDVPDPHADPLAEVSARELLTLFDEELRRLPEVYRLPILLCCLQGRSQEEAARQLGWTPGSLQGRLERGRARLHARLARRGVSLAMVMLTLEAVQGSTSAAALPAGLILLLLREAWLSPSTLTPRVLALAQETIRSMAIAKMKIGIILFLTISALAAGTGMLLPQVRQEAQPPAQASVAPPRLQQSSVNAQTTPRTDRYGDPLPPGALARLGTMRLRRGNKVYALPERDAFLSVLQKFECITVCRWRMSTGELLHEAEHRFSRGSASHVVSSDGKMLAAGGFDNNRDSVIRLWDIASGKVRREIKTTDFHAQVLAFSPKGTMIAAGDGGQSLWLWELNSKVPPHRFEGTKDRWEALAFSPSGKILASAGGSEGIRLWDTASRREVCALGDGTGPIPEYIVFSPDSKTVATALHGGKNKTIHLWDVATGKEIRQFHSAFGIGALAFSPDGKILAAGGTLIMGDISRQIEDLRPIYLWDTSSGREVRRLPGHVNSVSSLAFSSDGKRLISAGGGFTMKVWDVATGKEVVPLTEHEEWVCCVAFSPDGRYLASSSLDGTIRLWQPATGKLVRIFEGGIRPRVLRIGFAPDGRSLISDRPDGSLRVWDVAAGREIRRLQVGEEGHPCLFAYSPDGRTLAVRSKDGSIGLFDAASGAEKRRLSGGRSLGSGLCFAPDGGMLASMSYTPRGRDSILQVWDFATGTEKIKRTFTLATPLAFSRDGKTLFGVLPDTRRGAVNPSLSLRLWDMTGGPDRAFKVPQRQVAESLAVSPDGRMLAWDDFEGTITLWELASSQVRRRFKEHSSRIPTLAFSPDSKILAAGSEDTTVLLWDVTGHLAGGSDRPSAKQLWADLADKNAVKAFDAIGLLIAAPQQAVAMLQDNLKPVPDSDDAKQVARWIADLDSERFETRQQAMAALRQMGDRAEPDLRAALDGKPPLEARKRIEELLEGMRALAASPENLRKLRAVEVLERIGTPNAEAVLKTLADGAPKARLTREAKAALERLAQLRTS